MKPVIDASIFLGMNHEDIKIRRSCVQVIAYNFYTGLEINLEQIGLCDKVIWQRSREEQDAYYPFMDYLHTVMEFDRVPYVNEAYQIAAIDHRLNHLPMTKALIASHVLIGERVLYTLDNDLKKLSILSDKILPISLPSSTGLEFSETLRCLYESSLQLKLTSQEVVSV